MASVRMTFGSILGAVTTTADTATSLVMSLNKGAGMLNTAIDEAAHEQSVNARIRKSSLQQRAVETAAMEDAQRQKSVLIFCQDEVNKSLFDAAQKRYAALFASDPEI